MLRTLLLALALVNTSLCQQPPYTGAMEGSRPLNGRVGPPIGSVYSQPKGLPYCADIEWDNVTIAPDGHPVRIVLHGRDCRDSLGRYMRDAELPMKGKSPDLRTFRHTTIIDPVRGRLVYLNPTYKFGTIYQVPESLRPKEESPAAPPIEGRPSAQESADLGYKEIEGIRTHGTRVRYRAAGASANQEKYRTVETWYSDELKITLLLIQKEPDGTDSIMKLSNIQRTEPGPVVFDIPSDFRMREETIKPAGGPI